MPPGIAHAGSTESAVTFFEIQITLTDTVESRLLIQRVTLRDNDTRKSPAKYDLVRRLFCWSVLPP